MCTAAQVNQRKSVVHLWLVFFFVSLWLLPFQQFYIISHPHKTINMASITAGQNSVEQGWKILIAEWTLLSLSTIVVLLRLFARSLIESDCLLKRVKWRRLHIEDYLMTLSLVRHFTHEHQSITIDGSIRPHHMATPSLRPWASRMGWAATSGLSTAAPSPKLFTSLKSSRAFLSFLHAWAGCRSRYISYDFWNNNNS